MLLTFPSPYPDELLIGVYTRWFQRVRAPIERMTTLLFDSTTIFIKADLPHRLSLLRDRLPPWYRPTIEELIDNHTLLPFYQLCSFRSEYRNHMMGMTWHPYDRSLKMRNVQSLRYCPLCCYEDLEQGGEYYWHRSHQIPGVQVCPVHEVFLESSDIPLLKIRVTALASMSAETALRPVAPRPINRDDHDHRRILHIAQS